MSKSTNNLIVALIAIVVVVGGYLGLQLYADSVAKQKADDFFASTNNMLDVSYNEVKASLIGFDATIDDMKINVGGKSFSVDEFVLRNYEERDGFPVGMDASFLGVTIPVTLDNFEDLYEPLVDMEFKEIKLDFVMDMEFKEKAEAFDISTMSLKVRDLGEVTMNIHMGNVNFEAFKAGGIGLMATTLESAELRYIDHSLFPRFLEQVSREEGKSVEALVAEARDELGEEIEQSRAIGDEFEAQVLEELLTFIERQKGITVSVNPKAPIPFLQLMSLEDPMEIMETIGLEIKAD